MTSHKNYLTPKSQVCKKIAMQNNIKIVDLPVVQINSRDFSSTPSYNKV
jgi:hypothetical protein